MLTQWPANGPDVVWKARTGDGYACPAIADGRCILTVQDGADEAIVCWDAETGNERWRRKYPARFENPESGVGPHSTASIVGDRVYVVGGTGLFHCLAAEDGKVVWSHDLLKDFDVKNQEYGVSFSPLVEGDMVIAMPGGAGGNSLAAFNRQDGNLVWKSLDDRAGYSSPVAGTIAGKRQLVFLTAENILGVSPTDGKLLWKHPWPLFKDCNIATPTIVGDYVLVSSGYGKGCVLLEISADSGGVMQARPVYEHNRLRTRFSTSVLVNEHLYGFDETWLVCMEFRTGKIRWKKRGFNEGQLMAADGQLFVLGEQGKLVACRGQSREVRRTGVVSGPERTLLDDADSRQRQALRAGPGRDSVLEGEVAGTPDACAIEENPRRSRLERPEKMVVHSLREWTPTRGASRPLSLFPFPLITPA